MNKWREESQDETVLAGAAGQTVAAADVARREVEVKDETGGEKMGYGNRWMFRMTGLPGWIRFGFSPGWGSLPPMAQYLSQTGQLPQAISWFQQQAPALASMQAPSSVPPSAGPIQQPMPAPVGAQPMQMPRDQELQMLEGQAKVLESQLKQIRERINQLRGQK